MTRGQALINLVGSLMFVAVASHAALCQQSRSSTNLYPYSAGVKCGYMTDRGIVVINPQFDLCGEFSEGLASVTIGNRTAYIDQSGRTRIDLKDDAISGGDFSEGFATIIVERATGATDFGYIDTSGKVTMFPGAERALDFSEGLALVKIGDRVGYIDKSMKFAIEPQFQAGNTFSEGRARVSDESGQYFIDKSGAKAITLSVNHWSYFSEGYATIKTDYGYGFMGKNGKVVIKPQFSSACSFHAGKACVEVKGKWGFIGKSGLLIVSPRFEEADDFSPDGVAAVMLGGKRGLIDTNGKLIVQPRFDQARWLGNGIGIIELHGNKHYITRTGQFIEPQTSKRPIQAKR